MTGTDRDGIYARNSFNGTNLSVSAVDVTGGSNGIEARNYGSSTTAITVSGDVTGGVGYGISTRTLAGNTTNMTLNAGSNVSSEAGLGIYNNEGDSITVVNTGASVSGEIRLNDGSDNLTFAGGDFSGVTAFDGGDDADTADGFIDVLTFDGVSGTLDGSVVMNWEEINMFNSVLTVNDLAAKDVNVCNGSSNFGGATSLTNVLGCVSPDTIILTGDANISGNIEGAGGDDVIQINGNASVSGGLYGDGDGFDGSSANPGNDTILVNTTGSVGFIDAGGGNDSIALANGDVGAIDSGSGDDVFMWSGGNFASFQGGVGSDTVIVSNPSFDGSQNIDGGDDNLVADGYIDNLVLQGLNSAIPGASVTNFESLTVDGGSLTFSDGEIILATDAELASGVGLILINGGALNVDAGLDVMGNVYIGSGSIINAGGATTNVSGGLVNNGVLNLRNDDTGDVFTVDGDYQGNGTLNVDVDFAEGESDRLVIGGNLLPGTATAVNVNDITTGDATGILIPVVDVAGSTAEGNFFLSDGPIISGAFFYDFELNERGFALASEQPENPGPEPKPKPEPEPKPKPESPRASVAPSIQASFLPQISGFEALPQLALNLIEMNSWFDRHNGLSIEGAKQGSSGGLWVRLQGRDLETTPKQSATRYDYALSGSRFQFGGEGTLWQDDTSRFDAGVYTELNRTSGAVASPFGGARLEQLDSNALGLTGTGYKGNHYVDLVASYHDLDIDLRPSVLIEQRTTENGNVVAERLVANTGQFDLDDNSSDAVTASIEWGYKFARGDWDVVPQLQLQYLDMDFDSFEGFNGERVKLGDGDRLQGRAGVVLSKSQSKSSNWSGYVEANLLYDFDAATSVYIGGLELESEREALLGELGVGGVYQFNQDWSLKGGVFGSSSIENFGDSNEYQAQFNLVYRM